MPEGGALALGYYPSLVVSFQVLFEDGLTRTIYGDPVSPAGAANAGQVTGSTATVPLLIGVMGKTLSKIIGVSPRSASVELPSYRQAGTFSIEMAYQDFPLDPRVIRSVRVFIYLGVVSPADFASGIIDPVVEGQRKSILQVSQNLTASPDLLLVGLVDSIDVEHSASGAQIRLEGRDLRGILLDTKIDAATLEKIDLLQPIDVVIKNIVNNLFPQGGGINVVVDPADWFPNPIPVLALPGDLSRANSDAAGAKNIATTKATAAETSYWDIITHYCYLAGAIPYFVGTDLRIRPPYSLYDWKRGMTPFFGTLPTPFKGGAPRSLGSDVVATPEQFNYRRIVFGRDIMQLKFERKLLGTKVPAVKCVACDSDLKGTVIDPNTGAKVPAKHISGRWPPITNTDANTTTLTSGGDAPMTDEIVVPVHGVINQMRLEQLARQIFEEIGHGEMGGSIHTKNLASFGGDNDDPDILHLRPGDPVEIRVDESGLRVYPPPISELTGHSGRSVEEEIAVVAAKMNDDENLARVLVNASRGTISQLQKTFRVSNVKFNWDKDSGVSVDFDFHNYVEARYNVPDPSQSGNAG